MWDQYLQVCEDRIESLEQEGDDFAVDDEGDFADDNEGDMDWITYISETMLSYKQVVMSERPFMIEQSL